MRVSISGLMLAASVLWIGCGGDGQKPSESSSSGSGGGATASSTTGASASVSASASATSSASSSSGGGGEPCLDNKQLIAPIDKVSADQVIDLSTTPDVREIYIDAAAGGPMQQKLRPWIYVNLAKGARVDVSDVTEFASTEWDLSLKRSAIRTNDGDSGPGMGGAVFLEGRDFAGVTSADAASATLQKEAWFSAPCEPIFDEAGRFVTTFTGWYDYDGANHTLSPHPGTFIVRDAAGAIYKLAILDFYATPDGGTGGMTLGRYKLRYAKLSP